MSRTSRCLSTAVATLVAAFAGIPARPAQACGGFFCSQVPIDQSGEEIVFSLGETHTTAHILIAFTGNAKDFAWVVPVMTKPTIGLGRPELFNTLRNRTRPTWTVDLGAIGGMCSFYNLDERFAAAGPPSAGTKDSVTVVEERDIGPYNTVILESNDAGELIAWLKANGYDQPPSSRPYIEHYVQQGFLFVALKLKQDASVGEIQPIVLDMENGEACVPLILTRVAAVPDMPITTYTFGKYRAFPKNWFHVEVNQKKINWLDGGSNYPQVVSQALDEAGGRGFVTEFAGASDFLKTAVYREGQFDLNRLRTITDPTAFVQALLQMGFPRDATMQALLRKYIPMPASLVSRGVTERQFYNNLSAYRADLGAGFQVDTAGFIVDLQERIIDPLKKAQAMVDTQPYLTRLYSRVSPDEMTRDPLFLMNPTLPKVSNNHVAKMTAGECSTNGELRNMTLALETGETLFIPGPWRRFTTPPLWTYAANEGAATRIELVGPNGKPTVYTRSQAKLADQFLDQEAPEAVRARIIPLSGVSNSDNFFGCALAPTRVKASHGSGHDADNDHGDGGSHGAAVFLLGLFLTSLSRWRRRARRST